MPLGIATYALRSTVYQGCGALHARAGVCGAHLQAVAADHYCAEPTLLPRTAHGIQAERHAAPRTHAPNPQQAALSGSWPI
jgi:hypothetical protein